MGSTPRSVVGTLRFWQGQGAPYMQMIREALKPALGVTFVSGYFGASPLLAVGLGSLLVTLLAVGEVVLGRLAVKRGAYRAQCEAERDANPVTSQTLRLLKRIAQNTRRAA